ncbi:CAF1 family ribonuclease domain-containing protein [Phthorimaea operculella]|nr:CAF1 family ribonuclease domain-containing protein [Phthorimaea operculella]
MTGRFYWHMVTRCLIEISNRCHPPLKIHIKNPAAKMPAATYDISMNSLKDDCAIKNVWNHNLHEEFHVIRQIVQKYHWVAMDTEFPGVVARPVGEFRSTADYQYQLLKCNVDLLRIIQLGLTFMDESGKTPPGCTTWQFNFKFNLQEDMYAQDSIDLLQNSGLQFREHEEHGIEPIEFAELLMSSVYDVKYLMKLCKNLKGGLQEVADQLELRRVGPQHQAGSDSHLTGMAFFKIKEIFFDGNIESTRGHLYGLGAPFSTNVNGQENGENGNSS